MTETMTEADLIADLLDRDTDTRLMVIRRECVRLVDNLKTGLLLTLITLYYLHAKAGGTALVQYASHLWVANTQEEWIRRSCLSAYGYRRALKALRDKRLVEVKFITSAAARQTYIRLLDPAIIDQLLLAAAKLLALWESAEYQTGRYQ